MCVLPQGVSERMEQQRHLMKSVLADARLNSLRLEGGTVLARIRKEEACQNNNYRFCHYYEFQLIPIMMNRTNVMVVNQVQIPKDKTMTKNMDLFYLNAGSKFLLIFSASSSIGFYFPIFLPLCFQGCYRHGECAVQPGRRGGA